MEKQNLNNKKEGMQFILLFIILLFSLSAFAGVPSNEEIKSTTLTKQPAIVKGQVLVKFKNSNQQQNISSVSTFGVSVSKYYRHVGNIGLLTINDETVSVKEMVQRLNQDAGSLIEYAEPNYRVKILNTPNDSKFNELWGMHNTGQTGGVADADIDAAEAWDITTDASKIVVAVIDTGVDYTHPDLVSNMWVNPGEIAGNGIDDDSNGYIDDIYGIDAVNNDTDPMDDNAHGTHVAGTIGGTGNNATGVTGVAWKVQIMALKFLDKEGSGTSDGAIAAINYVVNMKVKHNINIVVTNNSWGGGGASQATKDAIEASGAANILFVAAAGNNNADNDVNPDYPASYNSANIISVASSDASDNKSSFSHYGLNSVDIAAPGSDIWSTIPNNKYDSYSGTSMAAPHVAGAVALLWSTMTNPTAADVKSVLMTTVDPLAAFSSSGSTPILSGGRLNIHKALGCDANKYVLSTSQKDGFSKAVGLETVLTATLSNCSLTTGATVTASFSNGDTTVSLLDGGVAPDVKANDGIYSANWTPTKKGAVTVNYLAIHNSTEYTLQRSGTIKEQITYQVDDQHAFNWIDISSTGTKLNLSDDSYFFPIDFGFNFYGRDYTQVAVGDNGGIYFEDTYFKNENAALPVNSNNGITSFIALMWDDLDPTGQGGAVYYEIQGSKLIIQYHNTGHAFSFAPASFQVVLDSSNGDILMQYLDVNFDDDSINGGASATIGLQDGPDFAQQYAYNTASSVSDNQAILWSTSGGSTTPSITSPADGTTLASSDVTFEFSGAASITEWALELGPTANSKDYFDSGTLAANTSSVNVTGLPTDGSTLHATLHYVNGNGSQSVAATYTAHTATVTTPKITSPVDGSTLSGSDITFEFSGPTSITDWWVYLGPTAGSKGYFDSGLLAANTSSVNVTGLPMDGSTIHATLYYVKGNGWESVASTYTANSAAAPKMTSPVDGSTLTGGDVTFEFSGPASITDWWVYLGPTAGSKGYFDSGLLAANTSSINVTGLPTDGSTIHATLYYINGSGNGWQSVASTYIADSATAPEMTSPVDGSTLSGADVTFEFSGPASITDWWVYLGPIAGSKGYFDSGLLAANTSSINVTGLPTDGSTIHATLYYINGNGWQSVASSYTAAGSSDSMITSPKPNSVLSSNSEIFSWNQGEVNVKKWWIYVGSTQGNHDIHNSGDLELSTSTLIKNLPVNGSTLHVRLWYLVGGIAPSSGTQAGTWYYEDFTYTAATSSAPKITSPTNGSTLLGSEVTFEFSGSESITHWWVYIGSSSRSANYYDSGALAANTSSVTVTGLPADGSSVHATLWYRDNNGGWQSTLFSYTAK